jgi:hypothetical protein
MTERITPRQFHDAVGAEVVPLWRAVLGYEYRGDSPTRISSTRAAGGRRSGSSRWTRRAAAQPAPFPT